MCVYSEYTNSIELSQDRKMEGREDKGKMLKINHELITECMKDNCKVAIRTAGSSPDIKFRSF